MPDHLTPEEMAETFDTTREQIVTVCLQQDVPIYQGKISKKLFGDVVECRQINLQAEVPQLATAG